MKKVYALYNKTINELEHLEKVNLNSQKKYTIFKLDNSHGDIWTTKDIKIAEAVRLGEASDISHSSREMPYNPYDASELEVVELDLYYEDKLPVPVLSAEALMVATI